MDVSSLSATVQDYLSIIYVLERDNMPVIGAHLAEILGVSPPTVTNTLKRMARDGLITSKKNGAHLTEDGLYAARRIVRRHMLMEWMMINTLPWSRLHSEAHKLEHAISETAESALMEQLGNPHTCPHGNPLPGFEETVQTWIPLTDIPEGKSVIIRRIHEMAEENIELLSYLESKQIKPGSWVTVIQILPFNQTVTIELQNQPNVTLGNAVAHHIYVEDS